MSGFEIAGLVLGAFPLLLEAAKELRGVFRDVRTWWKFEREFEDLISSVEREQIAFSLNLDILLARLDISEEEREAMQFDPNSVLWHSSRIQTKLERRINAWYFPWFMKELKDIEDSLEELCDILAIGKVRGNLRY